MRAILLGPNGQLGSDLQVAAGRAEWLHLVPVDRRQLDLSEVEAASRFLNEQAFDCLINCAAFHKTDDVERNAQLAFTINAHLVQRLAEICSEKRARLIHISTDYVFGGQDKRSPLFEDDGCAPLNVYGASKVMGEALALSSGADVIIARVASLFGVAGSSGKGGNFVETMIRMAKEKGKLSVVADQWMSPTSTADTSDALLLLLRTRVQRGIWHVVNSGAATWHEFATRIVERAGISAEVEAVPSGRFPTVAKRPAYCVLDNAKILAAGVAMPHWHDALDRYLANKGHLAQ